MDIDDEDDFYAPEEPQVPVQTAAAEPVTTKKDANEELESGEEEDEGGAMDEDEDSDIDIITERKDGSNPAPPPQSRYSEIKNIPQRTSASDTAATATTTTKPASSQQPAPARPAEPTIPTSTSKLDINAIPIHQPTGKPLTQVNIDTDLPAEQDKPWRKPGTDLSDYFNYGFDEFTWALYAQKQEALRGEFNADAIAASNKKMMEEMTNMMMMGGLGMAAPGGGVVPGGGPGAGQPGGGAVAPGAAGVGQMPGMESVSPEMQAMMQQMMASGMDPSQMDMGAMAAMYGGGGAGAGGPGQGGQGQGFGGGFGDGQGQGYGYGQQMGGGGGGRGGRGRGRRW